MINHDLKYQAPIQLLSPKWLGVNIYISLFNVNRLKKNYQGVTDNTRFWVFLQNFTGWNDKQYLSGSNIGYFISSMIHNIERTCSQSTNSSDSGRNGYQENPTSPGQHNFLPVAIGLSLTVNQKLLLVTFCLYRV